jgi:hypothetical protein
MVKHGVLEAGRWEVHASSGKFSTQKPLILYGKLHGGVLMGKCKYLAHDPGFWPAALHATATFSMSTNDRSLMMRLLDSWHHGAFAG